MENTLDYWFLERLNHWVASSSFFSEQALVYNVTALPEFILACSIVTLWFSKGSKTIRTVEIRYRVLLMFFAFFPTYILARLLQIIFRRPRPIINIPLEIPTNLESWWNSQRHSLSHLGAFPSDHAALFFIFTTVVFAINRPLGIVSFLFSVYFSLLRVGVGYHWPSDIIGGALLGSLVALSLLLIKPLLINILERLLLYFKHYPAQMYTLSFIFLSDLARDFEYIKRISSVLLNYRLFH